MILALFQNPGHLTQNYGLTRTAAAEGIGKARNQAVRLLTELEAIGVLEAEKTRDEGKRIDVWTYFPASEEFTAILTGETKPLDHLADLGNNSLSPGVVLCHPHLTQNYARNAEKEKELELPEDHSKDSLEQVQTGPAIWRNKDHDTPIVITGDAGTGADGRRYISIEGFGAAVPLDEIVYPHVEPMADEGREVFEI